MAWRSETFNIRQYMGLSGFQGDVKVEQRYVVLLNMGSYCEEFQAKLRALLQTSKEQGSNYADTHQKEPQLIETTIEEQG